MDVCEVVGTHDEVVERAKQNMPDQDTLTDLSELFKVFGDSTRLNILTALFESEMCVCDISATLEMSISAISHQLRILRHNKLVKNRKEGKEVFYSLADEHVVKIIEMALEHINE